MQLKKLILDECYNKIKKKRRKLKKKHTHQPTPYKV